jgi:hypothetical protein
MRRLLAIFFALLFLFGALVQYNDPDPWRWIAIYLAASCACALAAIGRLPWLFAASLALTSLAWAVSLAPRAFPKVRFLEMFSAWEMANERVEEGREMHGLLVICVAMSTLAVTCWRNRGATEGVAREL